MAKALSPTETLKQQSHNTNNFNDTTIADRLRTVVFCNDGLPETMNKPVYGIQTFPLTKKDGLSKGRTFENL